MKEYKAAVADLLGKRTHAEVAALVEMTPTQVRKVRNAEGGDLLDATLLVAGFVPPDTVIRFGLIYQGMDEPIETDSVRLAMGKEIRRRRRGLNMTQSDITSKARINSAYVSQIERGNVNPRLTTLVRIAAALDAELGLSY